MPFPHNEFSLIDWIRQEAPAHPRAPLAIGDDAAAVSTGGSSELLVTTDMLMEGTHFTLPPATPADVGYKAVAVNLSDIAAMAGRPLAAFISLALPRGREPTFVEQLYQGIGEAARKYDTAIAGGDTNVWEGPLVINVTLLGEPTGRGPVCRAGAQSGDWIMVTGALGGSFGGRHLRCTPRIDEAQTLHAAVNLHAMLDISDGVSSDLRHMLRAGGVGAVIEAAALPIHEDVPAALAADERVQRALNDGEDFELLFAVAPEEGRRLLTFPPFSTPLARIGEITSDPSCLLRGRNGETSELTRGGWEHQFALGNGV